VYTGDCGCAGIISNNTVVDIIVNSPDHNTLETAVIAAGLAGTLSGTGPFTVFAPTDAAFALLPADLLSALLADPTGDLTQILLYHVVGAEAFSTDLSDGQQILTLQGSNITVTIVDGAVIIDGVALVIVADLDADNGVVHVINAVLLPPAPPVEGCTAIEACNYNPDANTEDGSCILPGFPCDDNDPNTVSDAYSIDCICTGLIAGCTDLLACNYNPLAQFEDFTCAFPGDPCNDGNPETLNDFLDNDCNCIGQIIEMLGCTNMDACNYDMSADTDDGSCYFVGDPCDDGDANTTDDAYNANCECEGVTSVDEISAFYSVYPNPTNGMITIAQREGAAIQLIEVVDITGKRVATFNPNASMTTIDLSAFAQGLYTLNIRSNNEVKSVRIQKK
jgi:uncharacterized surface protein with fasciclin (FAS1) repeats